MWLGIAVLIGAGLCCCARSGAPRQVLGITALLIAVGLAIALASDAANHRRVSLGTLEFVAPVIEPGEALSLHLKDQSRLEALTSPAGLFALGSGIILLLISQMPNGKRSLALPAWAGIIGGLLAQHGGAQWAFAALAAFILLTAILPVAWDWPRAWRDAASKRKARARAKSDGDELDSHPDPDTAPESGGSGSAKAIPSILLLAAAAALAAPDSRAAETDDQPIADTITQSLRIEKGRLFGKLELSVTGKSSDTIHLLHAPVILTEFEGDGMRVTKRSVEGGPTEFWAVLERDGTSTAKLSYELPVPDPASGFTLPTDAAAVQHVDIRIDQSGWEITSPAAVLSTPLADLPGGSSGAHLVLGPNACASITLQPKSRDLAAEKATFFAEVSNLFIPGPGIVDGRHQITIRPSRGQLNALDCTVPDGFTVSDVLANGLTSWRFDPDADSLHLEFSPPVSAPFAIMVETQQGSAALPTELTLSPISVKGAEGQVGTLGIAFGPDAQLEKATAEGLSKVNQDDFDHSLLHRSKDSPAIGTLNQAYRYGAGLGSVAITVAPVAPDVRSYTQTTLSLGEERLVIAVDLTVNITRSGIFKLSFPIPDGLDIEAISGDSLASHTESKQDDIRIATLHLKGRTLGQQTFAITLAGAAPAAQDEWSVPRFVLREAPRQTGQLLVVPEQGIRTQPVARNHVSQLDARKLSQNRPGTLAFRLLEADWELKLRLESLAPWVTAQVLQEVTAREGLTRSHLSIAYRVENAAVKSLRLELPGLTADEEKTVRASGGAVSHIAKLPEGENLWELHFQRRILGDGNIDIDYQRTTDRADGIENIRIAKLVSAKQSAYWVAIRVSGHLEVGIAGAQAAAGRRPTGRASRPSSSAPATVPSRISPSAQSTPSSR